MPIAVGILLASEQTFADLNGVIIMGGLSLAGRVRHVSGVLPMAVMARDQIRARLYPLLSLQGLRLPQRRTVLRALDPYVAYEIDFKDALIVAHMQQQTIRELYSYDRDFDQLPVVNRKAP